MAKKLNPAAGVEPDQGETEEDKKWLAKAKAEFDRTPAPRPYTVKTIVALARRELASIEDEELTGPFGVFSARWGIRHLREIALGVKGAARPPRLPILPDDAPGHVVIGAALAYLDEFLRLYDPAGAPPQAAVPGEPGDNVSPWVLSSRSLWGEKLSSNKKLAEFQRDHPEMFRRRGKFKLEIHMGQWAQYWVRQERTASRALDGNLPSVADDPTIGENALAAAMQRAAQIRAKKKAGKQ